MNSFPRFAVIGAGLAGLTGSLRLYQNNYYVDVFEARGRVGGSVLSAWMEAENGQKSIIELGGHNITDGGEAKFLSSLIQQFPEPQKIRFFTGYFLQVKPRRSNGLKLSDL